MCLNGGSLTNCTVFTCISSPYYDDDPRGSIVELSELSWLFTVIYLRGQRAFNIYPVPTVICFLQCDMVKRFKPYNHSWGIMFDQFLMGDFHCRSWKGWDVDLFEEERRNVCKTCVTHCRSPNNYFLPNTRRHSKI